MIEIFCIIIVGVVTWMVAAEGIWSAAQVFLCTLLSALVAMNFYEPVAIKLDGFVPKEYSDIVALLGLFIVLVFGLRLGCEQIAPSYIQVVPALDSFGRWLFGGATGYLLMAFLLTSLHTGPLPREFMGFTPERKNFFGSAPDRQWLGFVQYISEKPLCGWPSREKVGAIEYNSHTFDGHFEKVGDPLKPYHNRDSYGRDTPQVIWPSFPIRYAMRRERYALNQSSTSQGAPAMPVAPVAPPGGAKPTSAPVGF